MSQGKLNVWVCKLIGNLNNPGIKDSNYFKINQACLGVMKASYTILINIIEHDFDLEIILNSGISLDLTLVLKFYKK